MVSCCTNIASPANAPTVTPVIATKDKQESDACVNNSHLPQDDIRNDLSGCDDNRVDKRDASLYIFSGFLDPGGRFAITTDSVHCPHLPGFIQSDVESCHGRIEQICPQRITSHSQYFQNFPIPSWVHVFGKSIKSSSLWTQCASVAYRELPTTKKVRNRCNCCARKKLKKQESLLTEATVPQSILTNLLSTHEINKEIIVFDGGTLDNPPIRPPDGVIWQCIPICEGNYVHICDEVDPHRGLTFQRVENVLPFIRLP
jgi:hypothetical protein